MSNDERNVPEQGQQNQTGSSDLQGSGQGAGSQTARTPNQTASGGQGSLFGGLVGGTASPEQLEKGIQWKGCSYSVKTFRTRTLFWAILTIILLVLGFKFIGTGLDELWKKIAWGVLVGILVIGWVWLWVKILYCRFTIHYRLNYETLEIKKGLFRQTTDTVQIVQVNDLKLVQTLFDKLINGNVGTLFLYTSDSTDPKLKLSGIDKPVEAFNSINFLRNEFVRRRGIKSFDNSGLSDDDGGGFLM